MICFEALADILREGNARIAVDRNTVIVVEGNELSEFEMSCERRSFARNALFHAAIAGENEGVVIDHLMGFAIEGA